MQAKYKAIRERLRKHIEDSNGEGTWKEYYGSQLEADIVMFAEKEVKLKPNQIMNKNGKQIIDAIVRRLNNEDKRCYDSAIVAKLASLNRYELSQLITFGEVDEWVTDRNNKAKAKY